MTRLESNVEQVTPASQTESELADGFNPHLRFFDADGDARISPAETFEGLKRIGFGYAMAVPATVIIHFGVASLGIVRGRPQNPFHLGMPSVGRLRHPDTAIVDSRHVFEMKRLDEVFQRYGRRYAGDALTLPELATMAGARLLKASQEPRELLFLPVGVGGALLEWGALAWLCGERRDGQQVLSREVVRRFYTDPQFFEDVAERIERQRERRSRTLAGRVRNALQTWLL